MPTEPMTPRSIRTLRQLRDELSDLAQGLDSGRISLCITACDDMLREVEETPAARDCGRCGHHIHACPNCDADLDGVAFPDLAPPEKPSGMEMAFPALGGAPARDVVAAAAALRRDLERLIQAADQAPPPLHWTTPTKEELLRETCLDAERADHETEDKPGRVLLATWTTTTTGD